MKIDFSQSLKTWTGEPMPLDPAKAEAEKKAAKEQGRETDPSALEPLTLREACTRALEKPFIPRTTEQARNKARRGYLIGKIWGTKEPIELGEEDVRFVWVAVVEAWFSPWMAEAMRRALDPDGSLELAVMDGDFPDEAAPDESAPHPSPSPMPTRPIPPHRGPGKR